MPHSAASLARTAVRYNEKTRTEVAALAGYSPVTEIAARATGLRYKSQGDGLFALTLPDPLGKQIADSGVSIFTDGRGRRLQTKANGRPLAELPYTT